MFSSSTKYAIRTIMYISSKGSNYKATVDEIARELQIPRPYLGKLMQRLSQHGIIESTKGRGGGFYLSKINLKRPLIDIVKCFEGRNVFNDCLLGLDACSDKNPCILHSNYKNFKQDMEGMMIKESIGKLIDVPKSV